MSHINRLKYVWIALIVIVLLVGGFVFTERYIEYKKLISESHVVDQTSSTVTTGGGQAAGLIAQPLNSALTDDVRTVRVSTVEDLLAAIGSNTVIELEPGTYDLTGYLSKLWAEDSQSSKRVHHSFGYLRGSYDQPELVIWPVVNLTIRCADETQRASIYSTYEHANVLTFAHSENITLSNLVIGTTSYEYYPDTYYPDDTKDALCFDTCANVTLDHLWLGGYNRYALSVKGGEGVYTISDTLISNQSNIGLDRENKYVDFNITGSKAAFCFENCVLEGLLSKNVFSANFPTAEMIFADCLFQSSEVAKDYAGWLDRDNVLIDNCTFGDGVIRSTDLAARASRFDPSVYWTSMFTADDLAGTKWHGVLIQYTDTAASSALPWTDPDSGFVYEANVEFSADGTGVFEWYNAPEAGPFLWKMVSVKEASFPGVTVEMFERPDASSKVLRLWIENMMIWMEPAE